MSKHTVTFIGDQRRGKKGQAPSNPDSITIFELTFQLDEPTVIDFATPGAQTILRKLKANGHFTVEPVEPVAEAEVVETFAAPAKPRKGKKSDGAASD